MLEALIFKVEIPFGKHINALNKCELIKVEQFQLPRPHYIFYFDLKKAEFLTSRSLQSPSFLMGGEVFNFDAHCYTMEQKESFGLFLHNATNTKSCTLDYELAVIKIPSKEFQNKIKGSHTYYKYANGQGYGNLLAIPWTDFVGEDSEFFIDGILHVRVDFTVRS